MSIIQTQRTIVVIGPKALYREVLIYTGEGRWLTIEGHAIPISRWMSFKLRLRAWFSGQVGIIDTQHTVEKEP